MEVGDDLFVRDWETNDDESTRIVVNEVAECAARPRVVRAPHVWTVGIA